MTIALRSARPLAALAATLALAVLAGCGDDGDDVASESPPPTQAQAPAAPEQGHGASHGSEDPSHAAHAAQEVTITATDYAFDLPAVMPAGHVRLTLTNGGAESHHATIVKLAEGKTAQDWLTAVASDFAGSAAVGQLVGGPQSPGPGGTSTIETVLDPGNYVVVCFIPSADGTPHVVKGMMREFTVEGPVTSDLEPAAGAVALRLTEYGFIFDETWDGRAPLDVVNEGQQPHEAVIVELDEGATIQDVIDAERPMFQPQAPQPYRFVGGTSVMVPGQVNRVDADLDPGEYALICVVPGPDGSSHVRLGMSRTFTVPPVAGA